MNRKALAVIVILTVLLLAALFVYYDHKLVDNFVQTAEEQQTPEASNTGVDGTAIGGTAVADAAGADAAGENSTVSQAGDGANTAGQPPAPEPVLNAEKVDVRYNSPEYDLKLDLSESPDKKTFIRMKYYLDGSERINELAEDSLPELAGLFEKRKENAGTEGGYKISQALLNPVFGQLYILINDVPPGEYMQSSFYMIDLKDLSVKKLFYYPGKYGEMEFNKDFSLLAYSFGDPPVLSVHQEDNLVEVFDCKNTEYAVKGNLFLPEQHIIGTNSSKDVLYDFWFEGWNTQKVLKLKMGMRPLNAPDTEPVLKEVLYDISRNLLLDMNGGELKHEVPDNSAASSISTEESDEGSDNEPEKSSMTGNGTNAGQTGSKTTTDRTDGKTTAGSQTGDGTTGNPGKVGSDSAVKPTDSEPLKVLKNFYINLNSADTYTKAMDMLDDGFVLKLGMLEQFGVTAINKKDISSEYNEDNINLYSELLKAANFDTIAKENTKGSLSTIAYYQVMSLGEASHERQYLSAQLRLADGKWKITLIEDGVK